MNKPIKEQHKIDEHADQQLLLIEHTLNVLLEGISAEELTTSQRLNFAAKILSPYVRMLALRYTMQRAQQNATEEEEFFAELRQKMNIIS